LFAAGVISQQGQLPLTGYHVAVSHEQRQSACLDKVTYRR